ncbi:phosphatidylinositol transfer protein csr1 [Lecanora helva]
MAGSSLAGRPGNLTSDQEEKLQEMWTATLSVFGVAVLNDDVDEDDSDSPDHPEPRATAKTQEPDKKKKKRTMFGRKKGDDSASEKANNVSAAAGDDKYGQTKAYQHLLDSQSPEDIRKAFWSMVKHDNPDGLLLRFLRARKWNVQNALIMLVAAMHWRMQEMHVDDDIVRRGEGGSLEDSKSSNKAVQKDGEDFLAQMRLGKSFLHGTDREGRPMCFVRVRLHKQGDQTETSLERYTVYTIETARYLLTSNIDTAAIVFDMTDFSMANMDYAPVKFMIKCFEANYPESLGVVLVHKSPWIFHSIWKIIKGWLDPVVASKIHFTKNLEELETFIEKSHIPRELGGDDPWSYHYVEPVSGENQVMSDDSTKQQLLDERAALVKEYEVTTQHWIRDAKSRTTLQQKRTELTERLRTSYWKLDPYLRARSLYDRTGMIREGGAIVFYEPAKTAGVGSAAINGPISAGHQAGDVD